jgi:hypothetical protein
MAELERIKKEEEKKKEIERDILKQREAELQRKKLEE